MPALTSESDVQTFDTQGDLTGHRYRAVTMGTADNAVAEATSGGSPVVGIVYRPPGSAGAHASIQTGGRARCQAGGSVTRGSFVTAGANGKIVNSAAGGFFIGIALEAASTDEIFDVLVTHGQRAP